MFMISDYWITTQLYESHYSLVYRGYREFVQEIYQSITLKQGYFISGKFDQYKRNVPYDAISQAFHEFCNYLLTENESQIQKWRAILLMALGSNGQVLIDVVPDLELILGQQPPLHKVGIQEAEKARIQNRPWEAMKFYEKAIKGAHQSEYLHEEALGYELAGEFYLAQKLEAIAQLYLTKAHSNYEQWGATAKVKDLETRYPKILTQMNSHHSCQFSVFTTTEKTNSTTLNLTSILKASQTLSEEVKLESLLSRLMQIVIENAGADQGYLILPSSRSNLSNHQPSESQWMIEASIVLNSGEITVLNSIPIESVRGSSQQPLVSNAIINYVIRTQEYLVLNNAVSEGLFIHDPYIIQKQPKSVLCIPLLHQGKLIGILYLENTLITEAFTPAQIEILNHLSSQIAISIENANLYQNLEEKVKFRTLQLEQEIQERKRAEEAAHAANQAKSTFLANMSHELRSPLNAILGFTQLMLQSSTLHPEDYKSLGIINRSGEHLLTLINNILDLSKIEANRISVNPTKFNLYRLLEEVEEMFQLKADDKNLQLIVDCSPQLPPYIETDEVKLRQVLINLINNALKFTCEGGVSVRVGQGKSQISPPSETDSFSPCITPVQITFEIEDTGPGIAPDELPTLFEAFSQTRTGKKAQEGTGLGLAISRQFVRLMGGELTVKSEVGAGTLFTFEITANRVESPELEPPSLSDRIISVAPDQPLYRILIVDDKWSNRQLLIKLLNPLGLKLEEASNGQEAVDIWNTWEPHLILMDMRMPVMDGYETTQRIKATTKGQATAIIALTASTLEEERAIALSSGCDDFVRKPFREKVILEKIAQHLGVRYVYQTQSDPTPFSVSLPVVELNPKDLADIAPEWVSQLHRAALGVNAKQIFNLIEHLPAEKATFAQAIKAKVNQFAFEDIVACIDSALAQEVLNPLNDPSSEVLPQFYQSE